jgi:hypothetical protein
MTDFLIMLLSTDWFFGFWSYIGIETDDASAAAIKSGCREIVGEIMSGAECYSLADYSSKRMHKTNSQFANLVERLKAEEAFSLANSEWDSMTHDELTAAWIYTRLTTDLTSSDSGDGRPNLDQEIVDKVKAAQKRVECEEPDFLDLCLASGTPWDSYTRNLDANLPTMLADRLVSFRRYMRLKMIWRALLRQLSEGQIRSLISWYRDMARFRRMRENLVPDFIS